MIGKAYVSVTPYYNSSKKINSFKKRPVLIVGQADDTDYVVLPISRVTNKSNLDNHYDIELKVQDFPLMNLTATSYIRSHKQTIVHAASLTKCILDFREEYPDAYLLAIDRMDEFHKSLIENAF